MFSAFMRSISFLIYPTTLLLLFISVMAIHKKFSDSDAPNEETSSSGVLNLQIDEASDENGEKSVQIVEEIAASKEAVTDYRALPQGNRIDDLFCIHPASPLPFIERVSYHNTVSWKPGKRAWIVDYAKHYDTSVHFIARSLYGRRRYEANDVHNGDQFNVFRKDYPLEFHLVVDISRCRMWLYACEKESRNYTLLSTYPVGLGRKDANRESGSLSPTGTYLLGKKVAVYSTKNFDYYNGQKQRMIEVFGTRWIPFEKGIKECSEPAKESGRKGFGIHGVPWKQKAQVEEQQNGEMQWEECRDRIEQYSSDGCIHLLSEDIEELFAIIITKETRIELVKDFFQCSLYQKSVC